MAQKDPDAAEPVKAPHQGHKDRGKAADPLHAPQHHRRRQQRQSEPRQDADQRYGEPPGQPQKARSQPLQVHQLRETGADAAHLDEGPHPQEPRQGPANRKGRGEGPIARPQSQADIGEGSAPGLPCPLPAAVSDSQDPLGVFQPQAGEGAELHPGQGAGSPQGERRGHPHDISRSHGSREGGAEGAEGRDASRCSPSPAKGQLQRQGQPPQGQEAKPQAHIDPRPQQQDQERPAPKGPFQAQQQRFHGNSPFRPAMWGSFRKSIWIFPGEHEKKLAQWVTTYYNI